MLRRVRAAVRRVPAVARLLAVAALLLVAAGAHTLVHGDGPATWVALTVAGIVIALLTGCPTRTWPLPAVWLFAALLASASATGDAVAARVAAAAVAGGVGLVAAVLLDVVPVLRARGRGSAT
ncbi:hypothetical protein HUN58_19565 [Curtobacterium sp. Csp1]|uniref:hypothetical protein n=1 Tax=unclassified Curtobacterium TaxID=257496 RepID=UPI001598029D|nr:MULTISPECIES: hypothetical protein [unclassified Curtobacterium]QKS13086.1 hypothetical protein HUN60_07995 [Curtobacterium sp. csp3]QKS19312.1 hypothetical protein HUN58_04710 [Curtobacterium sp. Csp1]QKS21789.1 hypothetical protein HUN58_19565 [Curtobacterium sp. Csp1]